MLFVSIKKYVIVLLVLVAALCGLFAFYFINKINIDANCNVILYQEGTDITHKTKITGTSVINTQHCLKQGLWSPEVNYGCFKKIVITPHDTTNNNKPIKVVLTDKTTGTVYFYLYESFSSDIIINGLPNPISFFCKLSVFIHNNFPLVFKLLMYAIIVLSLIFVFRKLSSVPAKSINLKLARNIIVALFSIAVINIIIISAYFFPNAEDFSITHDIINNKNPILFNYRNLDGRYTTNLLYTICNPMTYGLPPNSFKIIPILLVAFIVYSLYYFFSTLNVLTNKLNNLLVALFIATIYFVFNPQLSHALFFMGTAYHYTVFPGVLFILLSWYYKHLLNPNKVSVMYLALFIVIFTGINEMALMITPLLIAFLWVYNLIKHQTIHKSSIILLFLVVATIIFVVSSPGNEYRMLYLSDSDFVSKSIISKLAHGFCYSLTANLDVAIKAFLSNPFIVFLVIVAFIYLPRVFAFNAFKNISSKKVAFIFLAGNAFVVFVLPLPFYYSGIWGWGGMGFMGLRFFHNTSFLILLVINVLFIGSMSKKALIFIDQIHGAIAGSHKVKTLFFILFALSFCCTSNIFTDSFYDLKSGSLQKYYSEITERHEKLYNCPNDTILIEELKNKPKTLFTGFDYIKVNGTLGLQTFSSDKTIFIINAEGDTILVSP